MSKQVDRAQRAAMLVKWIMAHGFATRREILAAWREHGVRSEAILYDLEPTIQSFLANQHQGLGLVLYQHPEPIESAGGARHLWLITGTPAAAEAYMDWLVKHYVTRELTAANKAAVGTMLRADDPRISIKAEMILERAETVKVWKEQYDLLNVTGSGVPAPPAFSTTDIEVVRARWARP